MQMEKVAHDIAADPSFIRVFVLVRQVSDSFIASINKRYKKESGVRIDWNAELSKSKTAIKDLRLLQASLVKAGNATVMPTLPDSVGLAFGMPNEKVVEFVKSVQGSLTELKSRYPKISELQKDELHNLFFLSVTKLGLNEKQEVGTSDTYTIWDCLRDAYEELQRNKEAREECEERCRNIWIAEQAMLYATYLTSALACLALILPPAQLICALTAMATWTYWAIKSKEAAEECVEDCEELFS